MNRIDGLGKRTIDRPMIFTQSLLNEVCGNPCFLAPLYERESLAVELNHSATAGIALLLALEKPLAISRLVVSVVIRPVQLMMRRWARPHVGVKVSEAEPTLANLYAAPAVAVVSGRTWPGAASDHVIPDPVFRGAAHAVRSMGRGFFVDTSAALRMTGAQVAARYRAAISAATKTLPIGSFVFDRVNLYRQQSAKTLARNVSESVPVRMSLHSLFIAQNP